MGGSAGNRLYKLECSMYNFFSLLNKLLFVIVFELRKRIYNNNSFMRNQLNNIESQILKPKFESEIKIRIYNKLRV